MLLPLLCIDLFTKTLEELFLNNELAIGLPRIYFLLLVDTKRLTASPESNVSAIAASSSSHL